MPFDHMTALVRRYRTQGRTVTSEGKGHRLLEFGVLLQPLDPREGGFWVAHGPDDQAESFDIFLSDAIDNLEDYEP